MVTREMIEADLKDMLFIGQRAVLRGPNPNENNNLTGKTCLT